MFTKKYPDFSSGWVLLDGGDSKNADFDVAIGNVMYDNGVSIVVDDSTVILAADGFVEDYPAVHVERPIAVATVLVVVDVLAEVCGAKAVDEADFADAFIGMKLEIRSGILQHGCELNAENAVAAEHSVHDGWILAKPGFASKLVNHQDLASVQNRNDYADELVTFIGRVVGKGRAGRAEALVFKISHHAPRD